MILGAGADNVLKGSVVIILVKPPLEVEVIETLSVTSILKLMTERDTNMMLINTKVKI